MQGRDHPCIELACDRARPSCTDRERAGELDAIACSVRREFPTANIAPLREPLPPAPTLSLRAWRAPGYDPQALDRALASLAERGALRIAVVLDDDEPSCGLVEILSRAQPYLDRRNTASRSERFDRALVVHSALHDLDKPLVRADYAHALDVWQWTLRLDARAGLPVQLAALFHDVERLASEADRRVEQHAADYAAFKRAHARAGGAMARRALSVIGLDEATLDRVAALVGDHETPGEGERTLLNDADALSFFSLNSAGFLDYYGAEHTRAKVAYTLARLSGAARDRLGSIRLRADVARLLDEARAAPEQRAGGTA